MSSQAEPADLLPTARFDWERVIRRIRLPAAVKGTALMLASYADADGSRIHPGNERLARVTGSSDKTIRRHIAALRDSGLLLKTRHGNRHIGQANEYRLVVPADLLTRHQMTDPGELIAIPGDVYRSPMTGRDVDKPVDGAPGSNVGAQGLPVISSVSTGHGCPSLPVTGDRTPTHYQPQPTQTSLGRKVTTDRARGRAHDKWGVAG